MKEEDILLTGDKWTIVLTLSVAECEGMIAELYVKLSDIEDRLIPALNELSSSFPTAVHGSEVIALRAVLDSFAAQLKTFRRLLPTERRQKRGLINVGGTILKTLFGTMDSDDLERINSAVTELEKQTHNIIHAQDEQLTVIKKLNDRVSINSISIANLTHIVNRMVNMIESKSIESTMEWILMDNTLARYFRFMDFIIDRAQRELDQLQESIDVTALGRLSHVLVTPSNLTQILKDITMQLPRDISLITVPTLDTIHVYYEIARVHAVATETGIRIFVEIPLKSTDRYFQLFKLQNLPYFNKRLNQFVTIEGTYSHIAVSEDKQFYVLYTLEDKLACTTVGRTVCPPTTPVYSKRTPSCEMALFLNDTDLVQSECKWTVIQPNFKPILHKSPNMNFWIYSVSSRTKVTQQCAQGLNSETVVTDFVIQGTGILENKGHCYIHSDLFKLLPDTNRYTEVAIDYGKIIIPTIKDAWVNSKVTMESHDDLSTQENLKTILATSYQNAKSTPLDELARAVHKIHEDENTKKTWSIGIGTILVLIGICVILYCWRTLFLRWMSSTCGCRTWRPQPAPRASDSPRARQTFKRPRSETDAGEEAVVLEEPHASTAEAASVRFVQASRHLISRE